MPPNQNPYDFLNAPAQKKGFGATTQKGRIIQVAIGATVLLVIAIIVMGIISSAGSGTQKTLLETYAAQADLIALTKDADQNLRDSRLESTNKMIALTLSTQNDDTQKLLIAYGSGKDSAKAAKIYQDSTYQTQLKKALENNVYDTTYQKILADKLGVYRAKLNNAYGAISDTKQKTQLSDFYQQLELLAPSSPAKQ